jgi:hypothetical protein
VNRNYFRFGIKSLLVVMTLVAVWVTVHFRANRIQRESIAAVESCGGTIMYSYHESGIRSWSTVRRPFAPEWARKLLGPETFDRPTYIDLSSAPKETEWIDGFNHLTYINTLLLSGPNVDDTTVAMLEGSNQLLELHLTGTAITDDGIASLTKFPNLRWLVLNRTAVTDKCIASLKQLTSLEEVSFTNTAVTGKGRIELQKALPYIQVQ